MMRLPKMDHLAPATLKEACQLLGEAGGKAKLLAGGTDLLAACKLRNLQPALLVSLGGIPELAGIRFDEREGLRIGAMTSLHALRTNPLVLRHYPALAEAASVVGARQLQHMGTLGGNLCLDTRCIYYNQSHSWRQARAVCLKMGGAVCHVIPKGKKCYSVFSGDTAPALMALKATVKLAGSGGERTLGLGDLYSGDGQVPLRIGAGEILQEVMIPPPPDKESSTYLKYRVRGAIDFPLAGVAVRLALADDGHCRDCTVVVNAAGSAPREVAAVTDLLGGRPLTAALINEVAAAAFQSAHPVANTIGATPAYRRKMIEIMTRRALTALARNLSLSL